MDPKGAFTVERACCHRHPKETSHHYCEHRAGGG
jgi:hypothetical protein